MKSAFSLSAYDMMLLTEPQQALHTQPTPKIPHLDAMVSRPKKPELEFPYFPPAPPSLRLIAGCAKVDNKQARTSILKRDCQLDNLKISPVRIAGNRSAINIRVRSPLYNCWQLSEISSKDHSLPANGSCDWHKSRSVLSIASNHSRCPMMASSKRNTPALLR